MKGQVLIVLSVFIAIALLIISISSSLIPQSEDYLQDYFVNLRTELINTVDTSVIYGEDVSQNLDAYIQFSQSVLQPKGYDQTITYNINGDEYTIDIYLGKDDEYYRDSLTITRSLYP